MGQRAVNVRRQAWRACAAALLCGAAVSPGAHAHEFWLMPTSFRAQPGQMVALGLRVGTGWPGDSLVRDPERFTQFSAFDAGGVRPATGHAFDTVAGWTRARGPGALTVVYRSKPLRLELEARAFEDYLREEGLESVIDERHERGESMMPGRELYARCAKALIAVGGSNNGYGRATGLTLELLLITDPARWRSGEPTKVRLLFEGRPLKNALVKAFPQAVGQPVQRARTDALGYSILTLDSPGVWLLNTVYMRRAEAGVDADWVSLWASAVFDLK